MRLTSIKLAGFKSFVDPTTLHLPSNFTVVVGPNGCGKSNIIDAVRWVMGESAASRLRGDALTDVIFSGSGTRKPVSQASVELLFDNSDRKISGEYAGFDEIAVRRTVSRDGSSQYFLNGSRCRKRDVTELFLGTGLGPRSYAIIEQGMISQVIDARPEELRAHLEEAAGITLYKERRRETMSRIGQTRENLERLDDLRGEVGRQLTQLREQAEQAGRYRELEAERDLAQARLLALACRRAERDLAASRAALQQGQQALEAAAAEVSALDQAQAAPLAAVAEAAQAVEAAQAALYACQAEQTRLQQAHAHAQALAQRQAAELAQADAGLSQLSEQLARDAQAEAGLQAALAAVTPRLERAQADLALARQQQAEAEAARTAWQQRRDATMRGRHAAVADVQALVAREEFMARQLAEWQRRQQRLSEQVQALRQAQDAAALQEAVEQAEQAEQVLAQAQDDSAAANQVRVTAEQAQQAADQALQAVRGRHQVLAGQRAALQTLQGGALGQDDGVLQAWLERHRLADAPRLGSLLEVAPDWAAAVETALGPWLEAVVVPPQRRAGLEADPEAPPRCWLVDADDGAGLDVSADSLAAQVRGPHLARWLLAGISTTTAASAVRADAQGRVHWRHGSARGLADNGAGVLAREQQLRELAAEDEALAAAVAAAQAADRQARQDVHDARARQQQAQSAQDAARQQAAAMQSQLAVRQAQQQERQHRLQQLDEELQALQAQMDSLAQENTGLEAALRQARAAQAQAQAEADALDAQGPALQAAVAHAVALANTAQEQVQALVLERETGLARLAALSQALSRGQAQQQALQQRLQALDQAGNGQHDDLARLAAAMEAAGQAVVTAQETLAQTRAQQQAAAEAASQARAHHQQRQQWLQAQREALMERRLAVQAAELALATATAQAQEAGIDVPTVLADTAADIEPGQLSRQLRQLQARLQAMGAVNLAAIAQYEEAGQRHAWLEAQHADLSAALDTLQEAMARIDRETRTRFKETFDRINEGVKTLYPQLFGGGQAWLELSGEDLLDAGVVLMARPPGKKVSTLSLLSGGEKAMTAVALVFAIFQLNPAPFCLLDEVDAPLDEANVGRLAQMLRQMSTSVQFLSVSHNKATMEAADQLCGVTMREAGVSRLVSVDLGEAARLAGAA